MRNSQPAIGKLKNFKKHIPGLFLLGVIGYLLLLIKPAILGELGGTFKAKAVPPEYVVLKDFINNQGDFFRTFWVPKKQRFGFYSNNHPAISTESFVTDSICQEPFCSLKKEMAERWGKDCLPNDRCYVRELSYFLNFKTADILAQMAVKYVIVPFDSEGEIFIAEHQYNPQQREEVEEFLDTIPWLKKIDVAEKIAVYELPEFKDHFFLDNSPINQLRISNYELTRNSQFAIEQLSNEVREIKMIDPTKYLVSLRISEAPVNLVFSETYDELWQAKMGKRIIPSTLYNNLNSFSIDQAGDFEIVVEFTAQKYVYWGLVVSAFTLLMSAGVLVYLFILSSGGRL